MATWETCKTIKNSVNHVYMLENRMCKWQLCNECSTPTTTKHHRQVMVRKMSEGHSITHTHTLMPRRSNKRCINEKREFSLKWLAKLQLGYWLCNGWIIVSAWCQTKIPVHEIFVSRGEGAVALCAFMHSPITHPSTNDWTDNSIRVRLWRRAQKADAFSEHIGRYVKETLAQRRVSDDPWKRTLTFARGKNKANEQKNLE